MILCFDIGGTTMKGGRARAVDAIEVLERVPTPGRDFDAFAARIPEAFAAVGVQPQAPPDIHEFPVHETISA